MRGTDFRTLDNVRNWINRAGEMDVRREVIVGLDADSLPVMSHKIEVSGVEEAIGRRGGLYSVADISATRSRGAIQVMRHYARLRVVDVHTPFVVKWQLHTSVDPAYCDPDTCAKHPTVVDLGDLTKMEWI